MIDLSKYSIWLVAGSQHLYGDDTLKQVARHAEEVARGLDRADEVPLKIEFQGLVTTAEEVTALCERANMAAECTGVIFWMHTFSPAKMWIGGLKILHKPVAHLHTQFNREIPWSEIDMDFMNLNQSAHGGREFGHIMTRLGISRKVIVGHWEDKKVQQQVGNWSRVTASWSELQKTKVARFGDNMREVAVTEGDKVEAQLKFGFSVNGYGLGDLAAAVDQVSEQEMKELVGHYQDDYLIDNPEAHATSIKEAARIELGMRNFLETGGFTAFTDTFENLHGLVQLPGIAVQRLMADGYGFGAEGDWKTAALLRAFKVMESGLPGGTSFMEDYTYDFGDGPARVLGSHMLEICPSIASSRPKCEVHPLSIGGKEDPVRLVFDVDPGPAINVSLVDLGHRFRLVLNEVETVRPDQPLPKLPVARALWRPEPDLEIAAQAWILAGGAHHTVFSRSLSTQFVEDLADIAGIELLIIDKDTTIRDFKDRIRWNESYFSQSL